MTGGPQEAGLSAGHGQGSPHRTDRPEGTRPTKSDFAKTAQRISAWTSRLIVSAIVIVASLGFGRQIVLWWREGASDATAVSDPTRVPPGLGDPSHWHTLQFGGAALTMGRMEVSGDEARAGQLLRAGCRELIQTAPAPSKPPDRDETHLLAALHGRKPVEGRPGDWELHQWYARIPMLVGLRRVGSSPRASTGRAVA